MHLTATLVPSLLVARITLENAPVPSSLSSKLYFLANSEFASARSPDPPALEPCVGCRVSALSRSCAASRESLGVRARYYALSPSVRSARADAVRGPRRAGRRSRAPLCIRPARGPRRARRRHVYEPRARMRSAGRGARVAKRSEAARRPEQLETAGCSACCFYGRRRRAVDCDAAAHATAHSAAPRPRPVLVRHCTAWISSAPFWEGWLALLECLTGR